MANGPTLPPQAYTREILTSAFNWLQTQPESVKKLATTPDALVGLFMRAQRYGASSMELDAPVSSQNFISDLKNLAEGLKQFEKPKLQHASLANQASGGSLHSVTTAPHPAAHSPSATFHSAQSAPQMNSNYSSMQIPNTSLTHAGMSAGAAGNPPGGVFAPSYAGASALPYPSHAAPPIHESHTFHAGSGSAAAAIRQVGGSGQVEHSVGGSFASPASASVASPAISAVTSPAASHSASHPSSGHLVLNERAQQMIHEVKNQLNLSSNAETINMLVALGYKQLGSLFKN